MQLGDTPPEHHSLRCTELTPGSEVPATIVVKKDA